MFRSERLQNVVRKHWGKLLAVQVLVVFVAGYVVASRGDSAVSDGSTAVDEHAAHVAAGPTLWTCAMHPQIRQPIPGSCPICGMDLIPVAKTSGGMRTLSVSPESRALMSISSSPVMRDYVTNEIRMVGKVDYDETKLSYITAWVSGRLDRLYVDYTGVDVKKGDHMAYIYSEELYKVQEELIQAIKYSRERRPDTSRFRSPIDLVESAREKLRLLGLTEDQIKEIEQLGKPSNHVTIFAPTGGIVVEKLKQEGERVSLGDRVYTIADLRQVWIHLDAYESDLTWIRYGQDVTITTEAYPGEEFKGRIAFIQPVLDDRTRTVKVRVNVPNTDGRLKPKMFVHAVVLPKVAAGGRVLDPSLAGKWISPMHPEIVKDQPGSCDICGMPLVRAETLGYVAANVNDDSKPLIIPYSAALVTGTRAVVYVELPSMHSAAEPAFQTLSAVIQEGNLEKIRNAFSTYSTMLDSPYDQPGTDYAKSTWSEYADRLSQSALSGVRVNSPQKAKEVLAGIEATMNEARESFAVPGQPTFEGREIVLGPRAGDYYQVKHGLVEGQLVVTNGSFKIDAEIQIQAKPSMMTPEGGGGGGGHNHGGGTKKPAGGEHAGHQSESTSLPPEFTSQLQSLVAAYDSVGEAVKQSDVTKVRAAFDEFGSSLSSVDGGQVSGNPRMLWKEFSMLLGNDAAEGRDVQQIAEADGVYLMLKSHMRRMRAQLDVSAEQQRTVDHVAVGPEFQSQLARIWLAYLPVQSSLAADNFGQARQGVAQLESALSAVDASSLTGHAVHVWGQEQANLAKLLASLKAAIDIKSLRAEFSPLSDEIGVLARSFGFGDVGSIYELHCPMAMQGRGSIWFQSDKETKNPYFGSTMLKCADRVEQITIAPASTNDAPQHQDHSNH